MESNTIIAQKMQEFEELETITPSANWETNLNIKLHLAQSHNGSKKYSALLILLMLINMAFILVLSLKKPEKVVSKNDDFQKLTNELLITSTN